MCKELDMIQSSKSKIPITEEERKKMIAKLLKNLHLKLLDIEKRLTFLEEMHQNV